MGRLLTLELPERSKWSVPRYPPIPPWISQYRVEWTQCPMHPICSVKERKVTNKPKRTTLARLEPSRAGPSGPPGGSSVKGKRARSKRIPGGKIVHRLAMYGTVWQCRWEFRERIVPCVSLVLTFNTRSADRWNSPDRFFGYKYLRGLAESVCSFRFLRFHSLRPRSWCPRSENGEL